MSTINIMKDNQVSGSLNISEILGKLSPIDIPYYVTIETNENSYILKLTYISDKEDKLIFSIGKTKISVGKISGKIYQYECKELIEGGMVPPSKFKDKIKELVSYKNDNRFKININSFVNLLNKILEMQINRNPPSKYPL